MAITGISEFTFGFAFLFEQTNRNWGGLRATPILPSLRQEGEAGWDAHLPTQGTDYYYQFKLSDHLTNWNVKYILEGHYHGPYYRIALHRKPRNRQHSRLRAHSEDHPGTYYVAPEFSELQTFNNSFLAREITRHSRLIPVNECDDIDDDEQHYITYQEGNPAWRQWSEPKDHSRSEFGREIESLYRGSESRWRTVDAGYARDLYGDLKSEVLKEAEQVRRREPVLLSLLDREINWDDRGSVLRAAGELASVFLGASLVIVGE